MRLLIATALLAATAGAAAADSGRSHGGYGFCPPGLAKKSPPCVPPGQAKKFYGWQDDHDHDHYDDVHYIRVGDIIDDRFVFVPDPYRYGLNPDYYYYQALDRIFRVDPDTRRVIAVIGLVDALLN
jgi:hypothetical protein